MKLKKLLASVTAAALAVTTMAVTSFTASAASLSAAPGGDETVLYTVDLSSVKSAFTTKYDNGDWTQIVIPEADRETIMSDPNVYVKATMSNMGGSGTNSFDEIMGWGWGGYSSWMDGLKWYNNSGDGADFTCNLLPIPTSTADNAIAYAPISDLKMYSWGGIAGNLQCGHFEGLTVNKLEIIRVGAAPEPDPTGVWIKKSAGSYSLKSIARPEGAGYGSAEICPEDEDIPLSDLLPAGKTAADIRKITVTAGVGGWQNFQGAVGTNIFKEDGTSGWAAAEFESVGAGGAAGTVTEELNTPYGVDPTYTLKLQSYYMNYDTTVTVTITVECAEGGTDECEHEGGTATCQEKATCEKCGKEYGSLADHNYVDGTCSVCGAKETAAPCEHTGGTATCKEKATCEKCGEKYGELAAHNYVDGTCSVCGATETTTPVDPTPVDPTPVDPTPVDPGHTHTPATVWSSDATNHWHACSGCTDKLDSAAHTSDNGTVTTPATATTTGTKTYKCTVCGYVVKTETIPATGTGDTPAPTPVPEVPNYGYTGGVVIPVLNNSGAGNTPVISGDSGKSGWDAISEEALAASDGTKIEVDMNGSTKVPSSVFSAVKDKDIDIVFNMGRGLKWTVNGLSVTKATNIDFDFSKSTRHIPDEVVDAAQGSYKKQLSLDHNGNFGCAAVMTYDIGARYNGSYANLFYYNPKTKELELVDCSLISGGKASFVLTHASDYLITITEEPLGDFEDVSAASGISSGSNGANAAVFAAVLAVITAAFGAVVYKKRRHN